MSSMIAVRRHARQLDNRLEESWISPGRRGEGRLESKVSLFVPFDTSGWRWPGVKFETVKQWARFSGKKAGTSRDLEEHFMKWWYGLVCLALLALSASSSHAQGQCGASRGRSGGPGFRTPNFGGPGNFQQMLIRQQRQQFQQQQRQRLIAQQRQQLNMRRQQQQQKQQQLLTIQRKQQEIVRLTETAKKLSESQLETTLLATRKQLERTAKMPVSPAQRLALEKYQTMSQILAREATKRWGTEKLQLVMNGKATPGATPEDEVAEKEEPEIVVDLGLED